MVMTEQEDDSPDAYYPDAKILLVDDMEVNRKLFAQLAMRWRVKPDLAESGKQAIEMVKEKQYDLIFLDLMMPVMDGMETAERIREFSNTPLILLTADASDETKKNSLEAGFVDYMSKPIAVKHLERNFEKYLPKEYRIVAEKGMPEVRKSDARRSILETVVTELKQLSDVLLDYSKNDLAMFRIKVHGIKGFTRQIGKTAISQKAEIMEMAAKTDNLSFIERNIEDFLLEVKETVEEIEVELATLPQMEIQVSDETIEELFIRLKEAFDEYDLKGIQDGLEQLKQRQLDGKQHDLYLKLAEACDDIDYELGSSILEAYV